MNLLWFLELSIRIFNIPSSSKVFFEPKAISNHSRQLKVHRYTWAGMRSRKAGKSSKTFAHFQLDIWVRIGGHFGRFWQVWATKFPPPSFGFRICWWIWLFEENCGWKKSSFSGHPLLGQVSFYSGFPSLNPAPISQIGKCTVLDSTMLWQSFYENDDVEQHSSCPRFGDFGPSWKDSQRTH